MIVSPGDGEAADVGVGDAEEVVVVAEAAEDDESASELDAGGAGDASGRRAASPAVSKTITRTVAVVSVAPELSVSEDVSATVPAASSRSPGAKSSTYVTASVTFPPSAAAAARHTRLAREGASTVWAAASAAATASLAAAAASMASGETA